MSKTERYAICCDEKMTVEPYQSFDGFSYVKRFSYKCKKCGTHLTSKAKTGESP